MVQFIDLPDVVLLLILSKLPVWKILQLARLCHRLNHLKNVCFNTRFTHLRLIAGSNVDKLYFNYREADFFHIRGDFDLIIRFENQQILNTQSPNSSNIALSEDWFVQNVGQISRLATLLPRVTHLTVVILTNSPELPNCCVRLLSNWSKLKSLIVLKQSPKCEYLDTIFPSINSLEHLEHLQINLRITLANPVATFAPLLSRGKLKTFICPQINYSSESKVINNKVIFANVDRTVWNGPNEMIQALEQGLDTFGLANYIININEGETHVTNRALLHILKYFQGRFDSHSALENLFKWDLTDWTTLQCVHLEVHTAIPITSSTFSPILAHLATLTNLSELHLDFFPILSGNQLLTEKTFHNLPRLESVRKFQIKCTLESHKCFSLLARAFPKANELSLRLVLNMHGIENETDFDSYIGKGSHLSKLCAECRQSMKRAFEKYGTRIASFHWFLEQEQLGLQVCNHEPPYKVVPKVKLFTKEIAGRIRPNLGLIPID